MLAKSKEPTTMVASIDENTSHRTSSYTVAKPWVDLADLEAAVVADWDPGVRAFIQEGAGTGRAVAANRAAHAKWALRSRVLVDVSKIDTSTGVLGQRVSLPVLVAPSGLHTLVHPEGEVATATGCSEAGTILILSSGTGRTMDDVRATGAHTWFQLYWHDRDRTRELVNQAADVGFTAVCFTVDMPVRPLLGASMRTGVARVAGQTPLYLLPRDAHLTGGDWDHDARLTWKDLEWLREICPLPIVLKGIMAADDARLAQESGVDAVVVSNHGGRSLDAPWGTLDALPEIVDAISDSGSSGIQVYVDGGFRHGSEVLVALALGADAVLVGRPALWGLSVGGAQGVRDVLQVLGRQLTSCMGMVGARSVAEIDSSRVRRVSE